MDQTDEIGYIYCLSNESYKDTYKIGFTKNDPCIRASQLNTTGILFPFRLEFAKQVKNHQDKEKKLHNIFDKYRVNKSREFFKIELKEIRQLFDLIDGDWYKVKQNKPIKNNNNIVNNNIVNNNTMKVKTKDIYKSFLNITKQDNTHCSRCYDKLNISTKINCIHNDICEYCVIQLNECPKCSTLYKKN